MKGKSNLSQKLPYFKQRWTFSKMCKFEMIPYEMWEEFVLERTKGLHSEGIHCLVTLAIEELK